MTDLTWDRLRECRVTVPEGVVYRSLAHETVMLDVRASLYHSLDEIGGRFFEVMLASMSIGEAAEKLAAEYEQPVERIGTDMTAFCRDLEERGLIVLEPSRRVLS